MKQNPKRLEKKLKLTRETLRGLQEAQLDRAEGNGTATASFPCCPITRPLSHCC